MLKSLCTAALICAAAVSARAADELASLKETSPKLSAAGPLAFGPQGILFVGDAKQAAIFAIATGDKAGRSADAKLNVEDLGKKVAALLGTEPGDILINDLAVNPASGNAYLSVSRGRGPDAAAVIVRIDTAGKLSELSLAKAAYSKAALPNAPAPGGKGRSNKRRDSITDLAYVDGRVFVAGLSNEEFASKLRSIPFPFKSAGKGTSVEIFHGAHGRFETRSPIRTFATYKIGDDDHLLAAYTCTPLVKFPISKLVPGVKLKGTTIAELGNHNRPLDMIVYNKGGKDYILIANSSRGLMKVTTEKIGEIEGIEKRVSGTAGLTYEKIAEIEGVVQLDRFDAKNALVIVKAKDGTQSLKTIALP
ncbi:MAG: hypothetical protein IIA67_13290 [Planctomycetes bacterium]|nr:hypothetical protein [Planctomycetota bacterium]